MYDRYCQQSELTSSIVPRRTSFHRHVDLCCLLIGRLGGDRRALPCPAELGAVTPHAMQYHGQPTCERDDGWALSSRGKPCLFRPRRTPPSLSPRRPILHNLHAALPFLMLVAVPDRPRSTISSKRSTPMPLRQRWGASRIPHLGRCVPGALSALGLWTQWHDPTYLKPPGLARAKPRFTKQNQLVAVCGRKPV